MEASTQGPCLLSWSIQEDVVFLMLVIKGVICKCEEAFSTYPCVCLVNGRLAFT